MSTTLEKRRNNASKARQVLARKKSHKQNRPQPTAAIEAGKAYPIRLLPTLFGIGRWTLRKAEKEGLKVEGFGNAKFVRGEDLIRHIFGK